MKKTRVRRLPREYEAFEVRLLVKRPVPPQAERQAPCDRPHTHYLKGGKRQVIDYQRKRCYRAEDAVLPAWADQKRFRSFREVADYLASLIATDWFARRWPNFREVTIVNLPYTRNAWGTPLLVGQSGVIRAKISLSTWAVGIYHRPHDKREGGEWIVLHELAHALCPDEHQHSPLWCATYLALVKFRMGDAAYRALKKSFDEHGVRYRPYRQLSEQQRQALRERMVRTRGLTNKAGCGTLPVKGDAHAAPL